jgi:hypothetical protein
VKVDELTCKLPLQSCFVPFLSSLFVSVGLIYDKLMYSRSSVRHSEKKDLSIRGLMRAVLLLQQKQKQQQQLSLDSFYRYPNDL